MYDRENGNYRTPKVNSAIRLIASIARGLEEGINRKAALLGGLSNVVEETMPESNEIIKDLAKIQHVKFL